ncbi:hypothetical protein AAFF_G00367780 [Aldrovandia affinis]|uniref:Uncharacterized protein n=1 Tax=Aldrovandia affinis TaxID=143900 RepID=A0AAD7R591_9TELE|nr:hypothetical protein AAFF_G00367780 [Aldrovandia affinis]
MRILMLQTTEWSLPKKVTLFLLLHENEENNQCTVIVGFYTSSINARQDKLKRRLTCDFPQLVFHCPAKRNICELVFVETLSAEKLLDKLPQPSGTETTTEASEVSQESQDSDSEHTASSTPQPKSAEHTRTLYSAALILKRILRDSPGMTGPWPPTSDDLNVTEAKNVVPLELFNLIAWIIGATDEPTLACYVDIPDDLNLKVLSICQDIVYIASKGRKQTPKSLSHQYLCTYE